MVREKNCFNYHNSKKCNFTRRHEELHKQAFHEFSVRRTIFRYDWAKDSVKSQIHSYLEDFGWKIFRSRYPQLFSCRAESQSKIQGRSWWHLKVFMASKFFFFSFFHPVRVDTNVTVLMGQACDYPLFFPFIYDILWAFPINNNSTHACWIWDGY